MAKAADYAELWNKKRNGINADLDASFGFPSEFPYELDSLGVSSPVESVAGSTETESSDEEEDFFAALTRRLSQSSLHDLRKQPQLTAPITTNDKAEVQKTRGLAGSPQSTLSGIGSWSGRSTVSCDGSPNGSSRVTSPSTTPFADNNDPWEVIYAAAGQVARLKYMNGEALSFGFQNRGLLGLPHASLFSNQSLNQASQVQQQVIQEQVLKQQCGSVWGRQAKPNWLVQQHQQQQQKLQVQNRGRDLGGYESVKCNRPLSLSQSTWSPLQVHQPQNQRVPYNGSGSRAGIPGGSGSGVKRGCGGTGVFLPRHYGNNPTEARKKSSKSIASVGVTESSGSVPVLVPAKVVHALNLNIEDLNATSQPRFSNAFATDYDALLATRNALLTQQRFSLRREEAANYEIRLPQEWTY